MRRKEGAGGEGGGTRPRQDRRVAFFFSVGKQGEGMEGRKRVLDGTVSAGKEGSSKDRRI